jgi:ABC-2 type transport system ATP-binding protein
VLAVSGLSPERIVMVMSENAIPFTELSAHRASLEEAYMELTRDAVDFRARGLEGRPPGPAQGAEATR